MNATFYDKITNSGGLWFGHADTLLKAAAVVWPRRKDIPHVVWVVLMLRGMAVENLMKGIWVERGNKLSVQGLFRGVSKTGSHDLAGLARALEMPLSPTRLNVLLTLENAILVLGRYPVPKKHTKMIVHRDGDPDPTGLWNPTYERGFWVLIQELAGSEPFLRGLPSNFLSSIMATWTEPV